MAKKKTDSVAPLVAGGVGAVIGAGIGAAAASVMQNEKARKKVLETLDTVRERAMERIPTRAIQMNASKQLEGMKMGKMGKVMQGNKGKTGKKKAKPAKSAKS